MNCLISGINGFVGSHLAKKLSLLGHSVYSLSRNLELLDHNSGSTLLAASSSTEKSFDTFFHCASAHPSNCLDDKEIISGNLVFTQAMLKRLESLNCGAFVFCSTISVYGQSRENEIDVGSAMINPSLYGKVKLEVEDLIRNWSEGRDNAFHIIRMPAIIGEGGHTTFLIRLINAIKTGDSISIHAKHSTFNHVVYIDDLCSYMIELGKMNWQSTTSVVGADCPLSLEEVITIIKKCIPDPKSNIYETSVYSNCINISSSKGLGFSSMTTRDIVLKQVELLAGRSNCT